MPINFITIDVAGATNTDAYGINDAGQIVGRYLQQGAPGPQGFLLSGGSYTTLNDPRVSQYSTIATGINASGQIVGVSGGAGFLYSQGTYTWFGSGPQQGATFMGGINDTGQIVGSSDSFVFVHNGTIVSPVGGFLYSNGSSTDINDPSAISAPGQGTYVRGINNAGQIVGYYNSTSGDHGFLYNGGTYTTLDYPLGAPRGTYATGINNFGQIVGYYIDNSGGAHGFIDTGGVYTTIDNPLGAAGTFVYGINDFGRSSATMPTAAATGMAS